MFFENLPQSSLDNIPLYSQHSESLYHVTFHTSMGSHTQHLDSMITGDVEELTQL